MKQIVLSKAIIALHANGYSEYLNSVVDHLSSGEIILDAEGREISLGYPQDSYERQLEQEYYRIFLDFYDEGFGLACARPHDLDSLVRRVKGFFDAKNLSEGSSIVVSWHSRWKALSSYLFFTSCQVPRLIPVVYNGKRAWRLSLCRNSQSWSQKEFVKLLGITVCPYCNLRTLPLFRMQKETHLYEMTPDMDHYLDKGRYPFCALNIYNLIPACDLCNRRIKEQREVSVKEMTHPYCDDLHSLALVTTSSNAILNPTDYSLPDKPIPLRLSSRDSAQIDDRANKSFEFFGVLECCRDNDSQNRFLQAISNAGMKHEMRMLHLRVYGKNFSKERSDKLMYGCSLDPDRINMQAYSKIIIDLVDQVARLRCLCQ